MFTAEELQKLQRRLGEWQLISKQQESLKNTATTPFTLKCAQIGLNIEAEQIVSKIGHIILSNPVEIYSALYDYVYKTQQKD